MTLDQKLALLNSRFRNGHPSNSLSECGVHVRQFDQATEQRVEMTTYGASWIEALFNPDWVSRACFLLSACADKSSARGLPLCAKLDDMRQGRPWLPCPQDGPYSWCGKFAGSACA